MNVVSNVELTYYSIDKRKEKLIIMKKKLKKIRIQKMETHSFFLILSHHWSIM